MRTRTWGIASAVWLSAGWATAATRGLVIVPIADLRSEPSFPPLGASDDKQLTQLLFGESVRVYESSGDWVRVEAIEQPSYKFHQRWEGYPGWVLKSSLKTNDTDVPTDVVTVKWLPIQKSPHQSTFIQLPLGAHV